MMAVESVSQQLMLRSLSSAARPNVAQYALEAGLSTVATIFVDRLRKSMLARGPIPAAAAAILGGAVIRATAYAASETAANLIHNQRHPGQTRAWYAGVGTAAAYGARTGAISGTIIAFANPIYNATARRLPHLSPITLSMVTGTATGAVGSALSSATNPETWANGAGEGLKTVTTLTALGAVQGAVSRGALKAVLSRSPTLDRAFSWIPIGRAE